MPPPLAAAIQAAATGTTPADSLARFFEAWPAGSIHLGGGMLVHPHRIAAEIRRCQAAPPPPLLGGPAEVMIFVRAEGFYPVQGVRGVFLQLQAAQHAALNPGTLRVEDAAGAILWRAP
ncbi:MAG: hypothetical protein ACOYOH_26870 [Paracraurococcus sp.]